MDLTVAKIEKASKVDADFIAVASTAAEDRHGEVVSVEGWDLKAFQKNPVLLWGHDHSQPAIGKATKIWIEGKGKRAKLMIEGKINEATELARGVKQLVQDGVISTMSVGFRALEMEGNKFTQQELLEVSFVNVPANSQAMITAYKSLKKNGFSSEVIKSVGIAEGLTEEVIKLNKKVEELSLAKEAAPSASLGRTVEKRQMQAKVIARATDQLLGTKMPVDKQKKVLKVIKRASENLIKDNKEFLNGKIKGTVR